MTKKDYEQIAGVIRRLDVPDPVRAGIARAFAAELTDHNPRFDTPRFMKACQKVKAMVPTP